MPKYEVEFEYTTSYTVTVEADTIDDAKYAARQDFENVSVDHLPEMWPSDFTIKEVTAAPGECSTCGAQRLA